MAETRKGLGAGSFLYELQQVANNEAVVSLNKEIKEKVVLGGNP